jgi:hypothetical protein
VYQNHEFCGRYCANAWTTTHGQINTGPSNISWTSPSGQNQRRVRGGGQPGQQRGGGECPVNASRLILQRTRPDIFVGDVVKGLVQGIKTLISPTQQTQQQPQPQQTTANPMQTQDLPNNTSTLASTTGPPTTTQLVAATPSSASNQVSPETSQQPSDLPFPTDGGTLNQDNPTQLDPSNGADPISPLPVQSTSDGTSVVQVPDDTDADPTPEVVWTGMDLTSPSAEDLSYTSEPDYSSDADAITGPSPYPDEDSNENEDIRDGGDEPAEGDADVQSVESYNYPPSIGPCGLRGCSNPAFIDSITDLESEYCSREHQE